MFSAFFEDSSFLIELANLLGAIWFETVFLVSERLLVVLLGVFSLLVCSSRADPFNSSLFKFLVDFFIQQNLTKNLSSYQIDEITLQQISTLKQSLNLIYDRF